MYPASNAFHAAVANHNQQMAMLLFADAVFTNQDIRVDNGIEMNDYFNMEEDIAIGQTPSNEIMFTLFNDEGYVDNYGFGEFLATIGVQIYETNYSPSGSPCVISGANRTWSVLNGVVRRNGAAVSGYPRNTYCILIKDDNVYCFGDSGYAVYSDASGAKISASVSGFMVHKASKLEGVGASYNSESRLLKLHVGNTITTYEFVPLGIFKADRPNVPTEIEIDFTCYDRMQRFDIDMPDSGSMGLSFPATIGTILAKMCSYVGVQCVSADFTNSGVVIDKEPEEFASSTMRTVLGWIAEAAGCNAHFTRDGNLELAWLKTTGQTYNEGDYVDFTPYWYQTETVGKVYNRTTENGIDFAIGNGTGYLIQDNPFLKSLNEEMRNEKIRETKKSSMEKEAEKIKLCINADGNIDYEKLAWMTDDETTWEAQSEQWNREHRN